jgi:hypothetical protein
MKLEKRIGALEDKFLGDWVVLYFADGTSQELRGPRYFLGRLVNAVGGGPDVTPHERAQLELIRRCVGAREKGNGHMVEVIQVLMVAEDEGQKLDAVRGNAPLKRPPLLYGNPSQVRSE